MVTVYDIPRFKTGWPSLVERDFFWCWLPCLLLSFLCVLCALARDNLFYLQLKAGLPRSRILDAVLGKPTQAKAWHPTGIRRRKSNSQISATPQPALLLASKGLCDIQAMILDTTIGVQGIRKDQTRQWR